MQRNIHNRSNKNTKQSQRLTETFRDQQRLSETTIDRQHYPQGRASPGNLPVKKPLKTAMKISRQRQ